MIQRANGRKSRTEYAADREWLLQEEVEIVISHLIKCAEQGFPLNYERLKIDVDVILKARLGSSFVGVGKKWAERFVERNSDQLKVAWAKPLESKRADAANEHTNKAWWELLQKTLEEYNIEFANIYGVDEVGCQPYGSERERVISGKQKGAPQQRRTGNRENITVLVAICADGTSLPPAVIFKGKGYQMKWLQNNPANASSVSSFIISIFLILTV